MENNPYNAPNADTQVSNEQYQPKIFATSGRIGRLRYLAYALVGYVFLIPAATLAGVLGGGDLSDPSGLALIVIGIGYLAMIIFFIIVAKRRFNDLNLSGWWAVTMIIPLVNVIAGLFMVFAPGKPQANRFGPAPVANTLMVKIFGLLIPIIALIGIIAAVALPAYQDYVTRAQEASLQR